MNARLSVAYKLTIPVIGLSAMQSAGGLVLSDLYRDIPMIAAAMKGTDFITLAVVTPLLLWSLVQSRNGSARAQLVWMGCLAYIAYNYLYYLFGIALNRYFLLYLGAFTCSFYALIYGLSGLDIASIASWFTKSRAQRWIAAFLGLIGGILFFVETSQVVAFFWSGTLPASIVQFGDLDAPAIIFAADLSFVVPAFALAAVWLWQNRPWGHLLAAIMLVKSLTYGLALISMSLFVWRHIGTLDSLMPFYIFVATGGFVFLAIFLKSLKQS